MGNKYEKFCNHLKKANKKGIKTLTLPVKEIERINGYLPPSAKKFPNFWSNYKQFWLEAGYAVKAVFKEDSKIIIFEAKDCLNKLLESEQKLHYSSLLSLYGNIDMRSTLYRP